MTTRSSYADFFHDGHQDRLWIAVLVALTLHAAVILGVGFDWLQNSRHSASIEVTLVHHLSNKAPEDAEQVAQFDALGGGEQAQQQRFTTDEQALLDRDRLVDTTPLPAPLEPQHQQQLNPQARVATPGKGVQHANEQQEPGQQEIIATPLQPVAEIANLRAKLDQQKAAYSRLPHTKVLTGASARAAEEAEYLRLWIEWIERIGNENYPEEARRKQIYGDLRLMVALHRDGTIESIEVLKSSGQRVLDQAATRIVRLATPFAPIPDTIREDRLEIIRTWRFIPGNQIATE